MEESPKDALPALVPDDRAPARSEIEDGLRLVFHHLLESRLVQADVAATLRALIDTLVGTGALKPEEFERRRQHQLDVHVERLTTRPVAHVERAVDKYALGDLPQINCAEIIPICQARCCKLTVCLSPQDLDERVLLWDYGKPYQIRKRPTDGYCNHSEEETRRCTVYQHRPAICRSYDCRQDRRIWVDFEKRILQEE
jgi:hypothetical protein